MKEYILLIPEQPAANTQSSKIILPKKIFIQEYAFMNELIDPILAAGFHPLCPYHWVKYGFIAIVILLSIFAFLGIKNKYAQALITAGVITVATSPTWATIPVPHIDITENAPSSTESISPNTTTAPLESSTQHLLFALGSSTATTTSCYIINITEGTSTTIDAHLNLRNAKSLHLHWDKDRDLIFAIAGTASNAVDLYQVDPDNPSFKFVAPLMENAEPACSVLTENALLISKAGTADLKIAEYDLDTDEVIIHAMNSEQTKLMHAHTLHCTDGNNFSKPTKEKLPEYWTLTSKPAQGKELNGTYASITDEEQFSYSIVWLDRDIPVEPVMETMFPINAMGIVSIERD